MYNVLEFEEVSSTNTIAKQDAKNLPERTVILARRQSAGRGRFERAWISGEGGLYFSLILKPAFKDNLQNLTQLMCLSVAEVINKLGVKAYIKWPNDVLVNGQKICGILSEGAVSGGEFCALVLGTGVNVRQEGLEVPGKEVTSLKEQGVDIEVKDFLYMLLDRFFLQYEEVVKDGFVVIKKQYKDLFPYTGREVEVTAGQNAKGIVQDLTDKGELILLTAQGKEVKVLTGEYL